MKNKLVLSLALLFVGSSTLSYAGNQSDYRVLIKQIEIKPIFLNVVNVSPHDNNSFRFLSQSNTTCTMYKGNILIKKGEDKKYGYLVKYYSDPRVTHKNACPNHSYLFMKKQQFNEYSTRYKLDQPILYSKIFSKKINVANVILNKNILSKIINSEKTREANRAIAKTAMAMSDGLYYGEIGQLEKKYPGIGKLLPSAQELDKKTDEDNILSNSKMSGKKSLVNASIQSQEIRPLTSAANVDAQLKADFQSQAQREIQQFQLEKKHQGVGKATSNTQKSNK